MKVTTLLLLPLLVVPALAGDSPKKKPAKVAVFTNLFNQADTDNSGFLDFDEFSNSYGAHPRTVVTKYRFQVMSDLFLKTVRGEMEPLSGISLEAFIDYNGGRKIVPSKSQMFYLADEDEDGNLSLLEFAQTRVSSASGRASTTRAFNKLDKDGNNLISEEEWGVSKEL